MLHTYKEALAWIHSRLRLGVKPGLERMRWMLARLENPEQNLHAIHVGGTNGKGSTVTYLRSILNEAGYQVGTFTSPYIEQFNERISVNGKPVDNEDIVVLANVVKPLAEELEQTELGSPSEFEVITVMAFYYFAYIRPVDFAVFEVGLGGRYDSTNVIQPIASLITNVGMDHMQILGHSIEEIAYQKAGIIKPGTPIFTTAQNKQALAVLKMEAVGQKAPFYQLGKDFFIKDYQPVEKGEQFTYQSPSMVLKKLKLSLLGRHQTENAAAALAVLTYLQDSEQMSIQTAAIRSGIQKAFWPGRLECLSEHPTIFIDGAHNVEGLQAFKSAVETHFPGKKIKIVFSALKDKDLRDMFAIINSMNAELYLTEFDFPRATAAEELKKQSGNAAAQCNEDWKNLIRELVLTAKAEDIVAITGSLYFISEIKPFLIEVIQSRPQDTAQD
ncbi:bifunctional folylpolyglutamate synthase/dihydrofolate synthase [Lederbergia sp. NSJ-179]|uniref:bifunctional folylpolyglutamate synthase/dihydrofolate synthase n=1 Tax=Lederbergia sp. NSJ-179 TaxID=2931402 RepID=UPI001FD065B9|nr:folylpolyglutamate synthase/dihydrofolate synthase family protein [Lederbergia sp. NSJ-179]MCJ7839895.1 bifunctional folylpolyglutamate synthase/dihydrofolate synthase [Lederbergia sp. NSJ-179]